ncbi:MAG: hypothetical protein OSB12_10950 [Planctomycetota bacterium]|jgi:hypothetical protein|nr:hypothetical protein [Planctomycetota bacterium]
MNKREIENISDAELDGVAGGNKTSLHDQKKLAKAKGNSGSKPTPSPVPAPVPKDKPKGK